MKKGLKKIASVMLNKLPGNGKFAKSVYYKLQMQKEIVSIDINRRLGHVNLPLIYTVYWIDPKRIEYHTVLKNASADWEDWIFDQSKPVDRVQSGDWDALTHKVADMRVVRAIDDHIKHGVEWESTDFFKDAILQIESGRVLWGCSDRESFAERCKEIDDLIATISKYGYKQTAELPGGNQNRQGRGGYQEILINISRDGLCLFQDGRHRIAIARSLGIESVPVQVLVRHAGWNWFREFMRLMAKGSGGASKPGSLYQTPIHFDLTEIPSEHGCDDRWEEIKNNLTPGVVGTVLDIGCNFGFFCHRLEDQGYSCIGVEYLPEATLAARKIAKAEGKNLRIVSGDVLDPKTLEEIGTAQFSVVIALNIFHHFLKTEERFNSLRQFLDKISVDTLFFEPHRHDEPHMADNFVNPLPEEFVELIRIWGRFQQAEAIFTAHDGRVMYKMTR